MKNKHLAAVAAVTGAICSLVAPAQQPQQGEKPPMTFFVTSVGPGKGGDLGGLEGADAHCQKLAAAVGAGDRTWRAYLSASPSDGKPAVHARDRIGKGPWHNAKGELIARNVEDLHGDVERDRNNIHKFTALDEKGNVIQGRGDTPNRHDILTGSTSHGRAFEGAEDMTCRNWTSSDSTGGAMVGHHDRMGGGNTSWNSVHRSRGCGQEDLRSTGGDGLFYCFAVD
jgi:Collagenase NC10 and Endostatin.